MEKDMTKVCRVCLLEKPLNSFNVNDKMKDGYDSRCRECANLYQLNYNKTHKKNVYKNLVKHRKKRSLELKNFVNELKNKPCMDCGIQYNPWQMDFDHKPGMIKKFNISFKVGNGNTTIKALREEIAKCDIVCANCHRDRTYKRTH
jgi:hypothetical protein